MSDRIPHPMPAMRRHRALVVPLPPPSRRGFLRRALGLLAGGLVLGVATRRAQAAPQAAYPYIGEIMLFSGTFIPLGWLACNGQLVPIAAYETLFNLIGTTYGGDGQNTFGIPDLRGSVPIHAGQGPGLTNRVVGEKSGEEAVVLGAPGLPAHAHVALGSSSPGTATTPGGRVLARNAAGALHYSPFGDATFAPGAIAAQGGSQPHPNLQPILTVTFCIAWDGIWPSPL